MGCNSWREIKTAHASNVTSQMKFILQIGFGPKWTSLLHLASENLMYSSKYVHSKWISLYMKLWKIRFILVSWFILKGKIWYIIFRPSDSLICSKHHNLKCSFTKFNSNESVRFEWTSLWHVGSEYLTHTGESVYSRWISLYISFGESDSFQWIDSWTDLSELWLVFVSWFRRFV